MMPRSNLIDAFVAIYATNPSIIVRVACVWIHVPLNYAVGVSQWELKGMRLCRRQARGKPDFNAAPRCYHDFNAALRCAAVPTAGPRSAP